MKTRKNRKWSHSQGVFIPEHPTPRARVAERGKKAKWQKVSSVISILWNMHGSYLVYSLCGIFGIDKRVRVVTYFTKYFLSIKTQQQPGFL